MRIPQVANMGGAAIAPAPVNETAKNVTETSKTDTKAAENVNETAKNTNETTPEVSLEQVRAKLATLSQNGKQAQVKELVNKYAKKLTEIPPKKFAEVLKAAEGI